ncbi:camphor resistance protein CrcB [Candidatus Nitrososphaera evergladensis SR1]|uniref:Fluoride-specific ion channel FluC n=2 Tax=Nitrososphaera TaxID=497726 RepID=A0A075MYZ0_9ARCH|nr:camphor resistance protein CrcB [Candidatus Nitrososphaera evergladensis SR1]
MPSGYGISLGAAGLNRPFPEVLIMPTRKYSRKNGGQKETERKKMKGIEFVLLAAGAVAGAFLRYRMAESPVMLDALPVNVLVINITGSFILGVFSILAAAWNLDSRYSLLVAIGFCGSLTTMSSFALETNNLLENRQLGLVALNIAANVGLSIGAIIGGRSIASVLFR